MHVFFDNLDKMFCGSSWLFLSESHMRKKEKTKQRNKYPKNKNLTHSEFFFPLFQCSACQALLLFVKIGSIVGNFPDAMNNRTPDVHCREKLQMSKHSSEVA